MEEKTVPTLDIEALAALEGEERAAVVAAYTAAVEAAAESRAEEKYGGELKAANYTTAKYRLSSDKSLAGFGERLEAIEAILAATPALSAMGDEEKLRTAYYIDRGMREETLGAEQLLEKLKSNPEAMRLCEAAILEKLRGANEPALGATSGSASVPLTPQKKPRSIDEASALAREAFNIK